MVRMADLLARLPGWPGPRPPSILNGPYTVQRGTVSEGLADRGYRFFPKAVIDG
jgi:hypothetical protein